MSFNKYKYKNNRYKKREDDGITMGVKVNYTSEDPKQRMQDLEKALARFKKVVNREGLMIEMKEREYYQSPGRKRYLKRKQWRYKLQLNKEKSERQYFKKSKNKKRGKHDRNSNA